MALGAGSRLGPHEVVSSLGAVRGAEARPVRKDSDEFDSVLLPDGRVVVFGSNTDTVLDARRDAK